MNKITQTMILNLLTKKLIWFFFLNFIQLISHVPDSHVVWIMLLFWCQWFSLSLLFLHECSIHRTWFCRKHALLRFRLLSVKQGFFQFSCRFFSIQKIVCISPDHISNSYAHRQCTFYNEICYEKFNLFWSQMIGMIVVFKENIEHHFVENSD